MRFTIETAHLRPQDSGSTSKEVRRMRKDCVESSGVRTSRRVTFYSPTKVGARDEASVCPVLRALDDLPAKVGTYWPGKEKIMEAR